MSAPSFGGMIRAARLGFHWSERHGCFLRISGDGPFVIECAPGPIPPNKVSGKSRHWRWWDGDSVDAMLDLIEGMPIQPAKTEVFEVDELGRRT